MKPGKTNTITDVAGLRVGNAQDTHLKSGVTALICDTPFIASVAVHGGGPGTRDTELLSPENTVESVNGLVLSGGSAFGLDAASGVQAWMREHERGFEVGPVRVPIVPGAIVFDLINGGNKEEFLQYFEKAVSKGFDPDTMLQKVGLANQTTMYKKETKAIGQLLQKAMMKKYGPSEVNDHYAEFDTICDATQVRMSLLCAGFGQQG